MAAFLLQYFSCYQAANRANIRALTSHDKKQHSKLVPVSAHQQTAAPALVTSIVMWTRLKLARCCFRAAIASRLKVQHRPRTISSPQEELKSGDEAGTEDFHPEEGLSSAPLKSRQDIFSQAAFACTVERSLGLKIVESRFSAAQQSLSPTVAACT